MRLQILPATFLAVAFASQLGLISSMPSTNVVPRQLQEVPPLDEGECVPLPSGHYCIQPDRDLAYIPNFRGHDTLEEAEDEFLDFIEILQSGCSDKIGTLVCFHYFPACIHGYIIGPCNRTCWEAKKGCEELLALRNYPWPFDCSDERYLDELCADGAMDPHPLTTTREPEPEYSSSGYYDGVVCDGLEAPAYGHVEWTGLSAGSEATYECNEGYRLLGDSSRTCQEIGTWTGEAPTCIAVICSGLPPLRHGRVHVTGVSVGSIATYECDDVYTLVGEESRTCQDDGTWSGAAPTCVICSRLQSPRHGRVNVTGRSVGSIATYECDVGYTLVGEESRTCQDDGTWSGAAPTCDNCKIRRKCNSRTFLRNDYTFALHVTLLGEVPAADTRTFSVHVERQYLPFAPDAPQLQGNVTIHTNDCCGICDSIRLRQDGQYLFAGYYDADQWYLDTQDSLIAEWEDKLTNNLDGWVRARGGSRTG